MVGVEESAEILFLDSRIDLCSADTFVAEDGLDVAHIAATAEEVPA